MILLAAASAVDTYGGEGGKIAAQTSESSALPMTGIELLAIVGVAIGLIIIGFVIARLDT